MALMKCRECGKEVSTEAKACPHCGVASPTKKPAAGCFSVVVGAALLLWALSSIFGGSHSAKSSAPQIASGSSAPAAAAADRPMSTCEETSDDVKAASSSMVSWSDTAGLCELMRGAIGGYPTTGELRYLGITAEALKLKGYRVPLRQIALQVLGVADDLGRLDTEPRMKSAFDDALKVYEGTGGIVTPADLVQNLAEMTPQQSAGLSDQGLFMMAALIKEDKLRGG